MSPALSELSVTEFLALARAGFVPRGLVLGASVLDAGSQYGWKVATAEISQLSSSLREARGLAVRRLRDQAAALDADGVVDVRLEVEHHMWRGGRQVVKFLAVGTAVAFEADQAPPELRSAPSLHLHNGKPFLSDLTGPDFVTLLQSGYRPVALAMGVCVYGLDPRSLRSYRGKDAEITDYTRAFFDARETAMSRLQEDLFREFPDGHPDAPVGVVGMTVREASHGGEANQGLPVVEFSALGTAVAPLAPDDPRRRHAAPRPRLVVSLDR